MEDWYNVTTEDIIKHGGEGIITAFYSCSPTTALKAIYPKHNWMLWRFKKVPNGYWQAVMKDSKQQKEIMDWLGNEHSVKCLKDWYRISIFQIRKWLPIRSSGALCQLLERVYPQHKWERNKLTRLRKVVRSSQRQLFLALKQLFPHNRKDRQLAFKLLGCT